MWKSRTCAPRLTALLVMFLTAAILIPSAETSAARTPLPQSQRAKGSDAKIIVSGDKSIEQVRQKIATLDQSILQKMANKDEGELVLPIKEDHAAPIQSLSGGADAGEDQNAFHGREVDHGSILLGFRNGAWWCPLTTEDFCHAGIWDRRAWSESGGNLRTGVIRTSNTGRGNQSVYLEAPAHWRRGFQAVAELRVEGADSPEARDRVIKIAETYQGPYSLKTSKQDNRAWYCSKLVWRAYRDTTGLDIDADGGRIVFPNDIFVSELTHLVRWWE